MAEFSDRSESNEEEIVPLGQLRPSREAFGPLPSNSKKPAAKRPKSGSMKPPAPRALPASGGSSEPRRRPTPPEVRRTTAGGAAQKPQKRTASKSTAAPTPRSKQRPQARSGQPSKSNVPARRNLPARDENFANRLAAADRSPIANRPQSGWRGALLKASGGLVNVGLSGPERHELQLHNETRRPVTDGTVAVFSRKGGVGKTTISAYLGTTLAAQRGGRIVALDGDAEAGSLGWLLAPKAPSTLAALASADPIPSDYAGLRRYTSATPDGLEVIVGDPAEMGPISTIGLEAVADQLARHYDISIFDTGAGVTRATGRVLVNAARVLLLVMGPSVDSVRAAERTLAWLDERPGEAADPNVHIIAVINGIPSNTKASHIQKIESHFSDRCDAVARIPWDAHLASGSSQVSLDRLAKPTRLAFLELAAKTVTTLAQRPARRPAGVGARRAS